MGIGGDVRLFFVTGLTRAMRWSLCTSNPVRVDAGLLRHEQGYLSQNQ